MGNQHYREVPFRRFSDEEHETWRLMFQRQAALRDRQIYHTFSEGIRALGFSAERIPDIHEVNRRLERLTGWRGIPVEGLEEDHSFYLMLAEKKFPIGNFIRDRQDVSYTPAPDVFHDLYGHLPFLADQKYANFCHDLGLRSAKVIDRPDLLKQWARLFWFAVEFSVIRTAAGRRIFGAGIASSHGECAYALSDRPKILAFDVETIRVKDFKIDEFQSDLFELRDEDELYGCLDEFERRVR